MHKLPPGSLYRLQILAQTGARFYQVSAYMKRMETLRLIVATGRADKEGDSVEYEITDAGRAELEERYGPSLPQPQDN